MRNSRKLERIVTTAASQSPALGRAPLCVSFRERSAIARERGVEAEHGNHREKENRQRE